MHTLIKVVRVVRFPLYLIVAVLAILSFTGTWQAPIWLICLPIPLCALIMLAVTLYMRRNQS